MNLWYDGLLAFQASSLTLGTFSLKMLVQKLLSMENKVSLVKSHYFSNIY